MYAGEPSSASYIYSRLFIKGMAFEERGIVNGPDLTSDSFPNRFGRERPLSENDRGRTESAFVLQAQVIRENSMHSFDLSSKWLLCFDSRAFS
jgi:hypothetical protein